MMPFGLPGCSVVSLQKLIERLFLEMLFRRLGIEGFHFVQFFLRDLRQMTDKMHQFPAVDILLRVAASPGRHGCKANPVVDDPKQLAVRQGLRIGEPQIGRFRVDVLADGGLPASVVGMADCAMVGEVRPTFFQNICVQRTGFAAFRFSIGIAKWRICRAISTSNAWGSVWR